MPTESYLYDESGIRVKKYDNGTSTYYPFTHYEVEGSTVIKYYFFNGMRVAMKRGSTFTYLHADHLGSTVLETNTSGNATANQKYCAYGNRRTTSGSTQLCGSGNSLVTDHTFTGQKLDGTGLYYYNSRYYDPALGAFISPDTLVPRPVGTRTNLFDYNRYMYVRGRVLNMNDPSGHCVNSTTTSKPDEISYDNNECWRHANTIGAMWDSTDYWSNRFTSKDVFFNNIANNGHNGTDFFQAQLDGFFNSEDGKAWLNPTPRESLPPGDIDWADYVAVTYGGGFVEAAGIGEFSIIVDQYGRIYARVGLGANTRGVSLSFGGALYNTAPDGNLFGARIPVDQLNVSETERMQMLQDVLTGDSASASGTYGIGGFGGSVGLRPPYHATVEGIIAGSGASVAPTSRTYLIWGAK